MPHGVDLAVLKPFHVGVCYSSVSFGKGFAGVSSPLFPRLGAHPVTFHSLVRRCPVLVSRRADMHQTDLEFGEKRCRRCGSGDMHPSKLRWYEPGVVRLLGSLLAPYRCHACCKRSWRRLHRGHVIARAN